MGKRIDAMNKWVEEHEVGLAVIVVVFLVSMMLALLFLVVVEKNHYRERCLEAGGRYINAECLNVEVINL